MRKYVTSMSQTIKDIDKDLINTLELLTNELVENESLKNKKIKEWWNNNIEYIEDKEQILTSTDIWSKFKKDEKDYVNENNLLVDEFKEMLKSFIDLGTYLEKSKKGALEFIGFKYKNILELTKKKI